MTYPFRQEAPPNIYTNLKQTLGVAWNDTDQLRNQTPPGSKAEADLLAIQHAIEQLQKTLR